MGSFVKRKIITPLQGFLLQGITPGKLATTVSLGLILAVFPVIGATTLLCAGAALVFKLNMPAIQLINYTAYPLQFIFFLPFIRMGEYIFNAPKMPFSVPQIFQLFKEDVFGAIGTLWWTTMHAIVAWVLICPLIAVGIYYILLPVFRKLARHAGKKEL